MKPAQRHLQRYILTEASQPLYSEPVKCLKPASKEDSMCGGKEQRVLIRRHKPEETEPGDSGLQISIDRLLESLWKMKNELDKEYDLLLSGRASQFSQATLATYFFRFKQLPTLQSLLDRYLEVLQYIDLLISKFTNKGTKLRGKAQIANSEDFVIFMKFYFSKPYTHINQPAMRQVISILWDSYQFKHFTIPKQVDHLRFWIYGISLPLNPSLNRLHRAVIEEPELLSQYITHNRNDCIYAGLDESDAIGLTPFMVAAIVGSKKALKKLIKYGCRVEICPLTINTSQRSVKVERTKHGKIMFRHSFGGQKRMQFSGMQILRRKERYDLLADTIYLGSVARAREMKKEMRRSRLADVLQSMPDCSFQIDWQQQQGLLSFRRTPQDIISVFKAGKCLRVDYHVSTLLNPEKQAYFSLILDCSRQGSISLIKHHENKIVDLLAEVNLDEARLRFDQFIQFGHIEHARTHIYHGFIDLKDSALSLTWSRQYQCLSKGDEYSFKTVGEYVKTLMNSNAISYDRMDKSEVQTVLRQDCVSSGAKVKSKEYEVTQSVELRFGEEQVNFQHLSLLVQLFAFAYPSSLLLHTLRSLDMLLEGEPLKAEGVRNKWPLKGKIAAQKCNIQAQIRNLIYHTPPEDIFRPRIQDKYSEAELPEIEGLQDTVFLEEMYSINSSMFLGDANSRKLDHAEANLRFELLLAQDDDRPESLN